MTIKINKNSWHYDLLRLYNADYAMPQNLCEYFWKSVVFTLITVILTCAVGYVVSMGLGWAFDPLISYGVQAWLGYPLSATFMSHVLLDSPWPMQALSFGLSMVIWSFAGSVAWHRWTTCTEAGANWKLDRLEKKWRGRRQPGFFDLVGSYLKARKEKVCPVVTYVDPDDIDKQD
jgi:hypothetical protein